MDNSIGIYIHIPFCKSKCNYCDFNSYSGREHLAGPYFDALFSEMKLRAGEIGNRQVKTVFIGGGTPSLVDPKHISSVLELCPKLFKLDPEAEISMESNPGTLTYENMTAYRSAGVNRLSIGLQAWQDRLLKELGRIHDRKQFVDNFEAAVKAGFHNINADLIFGLPGQTMEEWVETLEEVTVLGMKAGSAAVGGSGSGLGIGSCPGPGSGSGSGPGSGSGIGYSMFTCSNTESSAVSSPEQISGSALTHLSCYSLKIEEGTNFGDRLEKGILMPADDELDRRMYKYAIDYLAQKGFRQYEISNFAKPGFECRHNLIYWKAREYAGFGAGAHSYLNDRRFGNVAGIEQYIEAVGQKSESHNGEWMENNKQELQNSKYVLINDQELRNNEHEKYAPVSCLHEDIQHIGRNDSMSEFMILGLRLTDGINAAEFEARFGESLQTVYGDKLEKLVKDGLLVHEWNGNSEVCSQSGNIIDGGCYKLTTLGLDLANQVLVEFI